MLVALASLASIVAAGCGGSLPVSTLLASARAAYPDCADVVIAERADGVRQWMVICGERRLFGLRSEGDVAREREQSDGADEERSDAILEDVGPPLLWGAAQRADDASMSTSSVVAWLRPLQVRVMLLGLGEQSWYVAVESPYPTRCAATPEIWVRGERRELPSAPTESVIAPRHRFAQRIDLATLRALASEEVELSYCGRRFALDDEAAAVLRAWAGERLAAGTVSRDARGP